VGGDDSLNVVAATLKKVPAAYHLGPDEEDQFIRVLHSALYGFVALESKGIFRDPQTVDRDFEVLIESQTVVLHWMEDEPE
jgi:hypothetical protein